MKGEVVREEERKERGREGERNEKERENFPGFEATALILTPY